ncbi:MAG: hypothetical protein JSW27_10160 [Phycisphaerales bacterium]|nr:MAG: hypothetical protein JSW27_10160 [Phycisphaerales bacterium]
MNVRITSVVTVVAVLVFAGVGLANWVETFDGGELDLTTWQFLAYPAIAGTFTQPIKLGDDGNHYVVFDEPSSISVGGAAFGAGFGSAEQFADVRVGATVNVAGDASHAYHGLIARGSYQVSDGSWTPAPGVVANCYILHINWENGPANLSLDIEKVIMNQNIMDEDLEALVPGLAHARSYYAELDVVGSGPVYVTGSLYEYKGGPLVAQTPVMVDTNGNDWWEDADAHDEVFTAGISGVFAQNEHEEPAGFYTTFDDIGSLSDGPSAAAVNPENGAKDVSILTKLNWLEAEFATSRQLWFGKPGEMQMVDPAPEGTVYDPGMLESGQSYQWRVDEIGPSGTVIGHTWEFTTGQLVTIDNFESYADTADIGATWPHNIEGGFDYIFLETSTVNQGTKAMRFEYQNQYDPFVTETTRTFAEPQDWTIVNPEALSVAFRGRKENIEQQIFLRIEDAAGTQVTIEHPYTYATQSQPWRSWRIEIAEISGAGVDLAAVAKITIGVGSGTDSGQAGDSRDILYIDNISLTPGEVAPGQ